MKTTRQLRAIPARTIIAAGNFQLFKGSGPMIGTQIFPMTVATAFERGLEAPVPYLVGSNSAEFPSNATAFERNVAGTLMLSPADCQAITTAYPDDATFMSDAIGDVVFGEPARMLAAHHASNGHPTYLYRFSIISSSVRTLLTGTPHGQELPYVFRHPGATPWKTDNRDASHAAITQAYWAAFVKTGDPNGEHRPDWPLYSADTDQLLDFTNEGPVATRVPHVDRFAVIAARYSHRH